MLIILGLRLSCWQQAQDRLVRREDVEIIALEPVETSTGEVVNQQFREAAKRCGVPCAIVSDDGRDLHLGLNLYVRTTSKRAGYTISSTRRRLAQAGLGA